MPMYTLHRNYVLMTLFGRSVAFVKGVPTHVPPICEPAAIAIGAVLVDGEMPDLINDTPAPAAPVDPAVREAAILKAVKDIVGKNDRFDFSVSGAPKDRAISREVGFVVDRRERDTVWQKYRESLADEPATEVTS